MKTIFITGSTDGIGKLAATNLAKAGHQVILHGRNSEKLKNAVAEIKMASNNEQVTGFISDFSDFDSVIKMAGEVKEAFDKIDVLINNAGIFKSPVQTNRDGLDIRFAVNYFAPYVLTEALLPLLQNADAPRLVNLSSAAQSPVSLSALRGETALSAQEAYAQSKLALTMWSMDLAAKHDFLNVIPVNPGSLLNTNMVREAYGRHWSSADKGADILRDLATLDMYAASSGQYFDNDQGNFSRAHPDAYDSDKIFTLLAETVQILSH